ncbi:hypothetical protein DL93DRAFT_2073773, partial [Clavulina sp. PMI_390]
MSRLALVCVCIINIVSRVHAPILLAFFLSENSLLYTHCKYRISDVTAILNTNAFWAYLISVWMGSAPWQAKRLWAVLIAISGVFIIVYGGAHQESSRRTSSTELAGDALTLLASVLYAVYQTTYKYYVALPVRAEDVQDAGKTGYERIPPQQPIRRERVLSISSEAPMTSSALWHEDVDEHTDDHGITPVYPSFGLHPNFITSCIGVATFLVLWPMLFVLHYTGVETFRWPDNMETWWSIGAVSLCGVAYNVGFMILLSIWGPTLATVGNLLTIVLVLVSDSLFGHGLETLTFSSLAGATAIVAAFGVLALEERRTILTSTAPRVRSGSLSGPGLNVVASDPGHTSGL